MQEYFSKKEIYKISPFVHMFAQEGNYCLLHILTLNKVYGGPILQTLFKTFSYPQCVSESIEKLTENYPYELLSKIINDFVEKKIFVIDNKDDLSVYVQLFEKGMQLYNIQHMYFIPTTECNFRCKYCFVEDENKGFQTAIMTEDIAYKGLELFGKLSEKANNITMTFYGGEPLINSKVLYKAMYYVRELEEKKYF